MNIQIDGTNTLNKGAELMLFTILKRIEEQFPNSKIFYNSYYFNLPPEVIRIIKYL